MNNHPPSASPDCQEVLDRLDSYLDHELDHETTEQFESHMAQCTSCANERALGLTLSTALDTIKLEPCPDDVFQRAIVLANASTNGQAKRMPVLLKLQPRSGRWRRFAFAASVLLLLGLGSLPFILKPADEEYSTEEVAQARLEVEFALGLINDAGRGTGVFLRHNVLGHQVVDPIERSLNPIR